MAGGGGGLDGGGRTPAALCAVVITHTSSRARQRVERSNTLARPVRALGKREEGRGARPCKAGLFPIQAGSAVYAVVYEVHPI